jgi:hypothetical protein
LRLDWVVPCRYAEAPGDGTATILGGGTDTFWVVELPVDIVLFLAIRVVDPEDEWRDEQHTFSIKLVRPDRAEEVMLSGPLHTEELPALRQPGWETGMLIPALQRWHAEEFGLYTLELYIDDRRHKSVAIRVRHASELTERQEPQPEQPRSGGTPIRVRTSTSSCKAR